MGWPRNNNKLNSRIQTFPSQRKLNRRRQDQKDFRREYSCTMAGSILRRAISNLYSDTRACIK